MFALSLAETGLGQMGRWLDQGAREFRKEERRLIRQATTLLKNEVRRRVTSTFKNKSGELRRQIGSSVKGQSPLIEGRVFIRKRFYYAILETGGEIVAKKGKYLVFPVGEGLVRRRVRVSGSKKRVLSETGGDLVHVRKVTIGRHPFFEPALEAKREQALEIVGRSFDVFTEGRRAA